MFWDLLGSGYECSALKNRRTVSVLPMVYGCVFRKPDYFR